MPQKPKRILVVGNSCAGKTTFSSRLANSIGCKHIELDALFWEANWKEAKNEDFRAKVSTALTTHSWVVDGNYTRRVNDIVWPAADTVIWLDLPLHLILRRFFARSLMRSLKGTLLWGHSKETLRNSIFSKNSLFIWILKSYGKNRAEFSKLIKDAPLGVTIHRLKTKREVERLFHSFKQ